MSAVTGISPVGLFPCMCSSFKWFTNVNYSFQGTILDSANSDMNFINCQNNYDDQDRVFMNTASSSYSSASQRFALIKLLKLIDDVVLPDNATNC